MFVKSYNPHTNKYFWFKDTPIDRLLSTTTPNETVTFYNQMIQNIEMNFPLDLRFEKYLISLSWRSFAINILDKPSEILAETDVLLIQTTLEISARVNLRKCFTIFNKSVETNIKRKVIYCTGIIEIRSNFYLILKPIFYI